MTITPFHDSAGSEGLVRLPEDAADHLARTAPRHFAARDSLRYSAGNDVDAAVQRVLRLTECGYLPCVRIGTEVYWQPDQLEGWVRALWLDQGCRFSSSQAVSASSAQTAVCLANDADDFEGRLRYPLNVAEILAAIAPQYFAATRPHLYPAGGRRDAAVKRVLRLTSYGYLPHVRVGDRVHWRRDQLEGWVRAVWLDRAPAGSQAD